MITQDQEPRRSDRIAARVVEGKALIVVIDHKRLHTLNSVGTRIFELCDGRSVGAIAAALTAEFEIDHATALRDVQRFVLELQRLGALEPEAA